MPVETVLPTDIVIAKHVVETRSPTSTREARMVGEFIYWYCSQTCRTPSLKLIFGFHPAAFLNFVTSAFVS